LILTWHKFYLPTVGLWQQKYATLIATGIAVCSAKGRDSPLFREPTLPDNTTRGKNSFLFCDLLVRSNIASGCFFSGLLESRFGLSMVAGKNRRNLFAMAAWNVVGA
jgi:hypothetical protein